MPKKYNDRSMQADTEDATPEGELFFFPKQNPPVSVRAGSREEAEKILANKKENE